MTFLTSFSCSGVWDLELLGVFLSFPLDRFYTRDIFKDQLLLLLKLNNYSIIISPRASFPYCSCPPLFAFEKSYFSSTTTC